MSMRLQVNLIITILLGALAALLIGLQIENTRRSVRDEIVGANVVAVQLLSRVEWASEQDDLEALTKFLRRVGRIRAHEVELYDGAGQLLYRSPPTLYKAGRDAPGWYARIVSPPLSPREINLPSGKILLRADPSRATLDGWDDLLPMLWFVLTGFLLSNALVYALMGRAMKPLHLVIGGLRSIEEGNWDSRLPQLSGQEGRLISQAFNRMAQSVQDSIQAQRQAQEATEALAQNRELTQLIQARIEEERGAIARELHDELGQQVTAIKSIGLAIAQRTAGRDTKSEESARLVAECADQIYDGVHRIISRLRPIALDQFGLQDALEDLLADHRLLHRDMQLRMAVDGNFDDLDNAHATAVYRIVQEAVTNSLRHAQARRIEIALTSKPDGLTIDIADDGQGNPSTFDTRGHYGLLGMQERVLALGGKLTITAKVPSGVRIWAWLPSAIKNQERGSP